MQGMRLAMLWKETASKTKDKARKHVYVCAHLHTKIADMSTFGKNPTAPECETKTRS